MSIESTPSDNTPNLDKQRDIISVLRQEQEEYDRLDEFDQWTWSTHRAETLSNELGENPIRISMEAKEIGIQIRGDEDIYSLKLADNQSVKFHGYIGSITNGRVADVNGFIVRIIEPNLRFYNEQTTEPLEISILAPVPNITTYEYLSDDVA